MRQCFIQKKKQNVTIIFKTVQYNKINNRQHNTIHKHLYQKFQTLCVCARAQMTNELFSILTVFTLIVLCF